MPGRERWKIRRMSHLSSRVVPEAGGKCGQPVGSTFGAPDLTPTQNPDDSTTPIRGHTAYIHTHLAHIDYGWKT